MKTVIVSMLLMLLLASCSTPVGPSDVDKANALCQQNDGLAELSKNKLFDRWMVTIRCNNGAEFKVFKDGVWKGSNKK